MAVAAVVWWPLSGEIQIKANVWTSGRSEEEFLNASSLLLPQEDVNY